MLCFIFLHFSGRICVAVRIMHCPLMVTLMLISFSLIAVASLILKAIYRYLSTTILSSSSP
jgi:hypothetical protein